MTRRAARVLDDFLGEALGETGSLATGEQLGAACAPAMPTDAVRARLVSSLARTHRFDDLEDLVAEIADLPIDRARELLLDVDRPEVWEAGMTPEITG